MKKSFFILLVLSVIGGVFWLAGDALAQGYKFLEPLPNLPEILPTDQTGKYFATLYQLGVGLAGLLAVIMIAFGGVEYIASAANPGLREKAKERITMAIVGLLLALGSYVILSTISPNLTGFTVSLPPSPSSVTPTQEQVAQANAIQQKWKSAGVGYKDQCTYGNTTNCNGYQLPDTAVDGVADLKAACTKKYKDCEVYVSGGSEIHPGSTEQGIKNGTQHAPGNGVVDIRSNPALDTYIKGLGKPVNGTIVDSNYVKYTYEKGGVGNSTGDHWHVVYPQKGYGSN